MMKYYILLLCVIAYAQAVDKEFVIKFIEELREVGTKCIPETGATGDDVIKLLNHVIPESHEGKCLIFCYHKYYKMQNDDGSINEAGFMESMERLKQHDADLYDKFLKIYHVCSQEVAVNSDPCLYAGDLSACAIREAHAMGLKEDLMIE